MHGHTMLRGQLDAYSESWKNLHVQAIEYWDVQNVLQISLSLFDSIRAMDERWNDDVRNERRVYAQEEADEFYNFYRGWLPPAEEILNNVLRCQRNGFELESADRFREAVIHAKLATSETVQEIQFAS